MPVITLTTDMGLKDYYEASVKGAILSLCPKARIIDISHDVRPFDIVQASFILRNTYRDFPPGTVHIIGVAPNQTEEHRHKVVLHEGQYFIGTDNGIFSLLFDQEPEKVWTLDLPVPPEEMTFPTKHVFVKAACHIINGGSMEALGKSGGSLLESSHFRAVVQENTIRGSVIYIDSYGDVITNITRKRFETTGQGRPFTIFFRRYQIQKISQNYNNVPEGEKLALFGATGFLEIAINKGAPGSGGGAASLFGLKINDTVTIEFS